MDIENDRKVIPPNRSLANHMGIGNAIDRLPDLRSHRDLDECERDRKFERSTPARAQRAKVLSTAARQTDKISSETMMNATIM